MAKELLGWHGLRCDYCLSLWLIHW